MATYLDLPTWDTLHRLPGIAAAGMRRSFFFIKHRAHNLAMAKKRKGRDRVEHLIRIVEIHTRRLHVSARIENPNASSPQRRDSSWLEVAGIMDEPVKGTKDIRISIHEAEDNVLGPKRPAVIGFVFGTKPEVHAVVTVGPKLFDRTWIMAATGTLRNAWISMTPPKWGNADAPSVSFSNEPIE